MSTLERTDILPMKEIFLYIEVFGDRSKEQKVLEKKKGMHFQVSGLLREWKTLSSKFWHRFVSVLVQQQ